MRTIQRIFIGLLITGLLIGCGIFESSSNKAKINQKSNLISSMTIMDLHMVTLHSGWIVEAHQIYFQRGRSHNPTNITPRHLGPLTIVSFKALSAKKAVAVVRTENASYYIVTSSAGGTWHSQTLPGMVAASTPASIAVSPDGQTGYVLATDQGQRLYRINREYVTPLILPSLTRGVWNRVAFNSKEDGYLVGYSLSKAQIVIDQTSDGGKVWSSVPVSLPASIARSDNAAGAQAVGLIWTTAGPRLFVNWVTEKYDWWNQYSLTRGGWQPTGSMHKGWLWEIYQAQQGHHYLMLESPRNISGSRTILYGNKDHILARFSQHSKVSQYTKIDLLNPHSLWIYGGNGYVHGIWNTFNDGKSWHSGL